MADYWPENGTLPVPTITDIERQKAFEISCIKGGRDKFIRDTTVTVKNASGEMVNRMVDVGETSPGRRVIRDIIGNGVDPGAWRAVNILKEETLGHLTCGGKGKNTPDWMFVIAHRPSQDLAYMTVREMLRIPWNTKNQGVDVNSTPLTRIALHVGTVIRDQYSLDTWVEDSRMKAKTDGGIDVAKYMMASVKGNVSRRQISRWKNRGAEISQLNWPTQMRLGLGTALIDSVVRHSGGWFQISKSYLKGKTIWTVNVSPEMVLRLRDVIGAEEISHPIRRPTIVPPKPWKEK